MNKKIRILLLSSYLWYFGAGLLGPLYAVFSERIGGDLLEMTMAYSTYLIVTGVLSIGVGRLSDKYSREKLMVMGYLLNTLATFGFLLVQHPLELFFVQIMLGIAAALATPTWDSLFSRHVDPSKDGEEWGLSDGGPHVISGISLLCGGVIVTYLGFTFLFISMGIIQALATIVQANLQHKYR